MVAEVKAMETVVIKSKPKDEFASFSWDWMDSLLSSTNEFVEHFESVKAQIANYKTKRAAGEIALINNRFRLYHFNKVLAMVASAIYIQGVRKLEAGEVDEEETLVEVKK